MLRQEASTALSKHHSRESDWRIPDNARPMRRKIRTFSTRNQRPIGKVLEMQKHEEVWKLRGASTNEQMVVEMPMKPHERVHVQLAE